MKTLRLLPIIAFSLYSSHSFSTGFAQTGFTGYLRTPDAQVIDYQSLNLSFGWEDNVDYDGGYANGAHHTLMLGAGLFPGLELVIQNTYKNFNGDPGYNQGNAASDLSFSLKLNSEPLLADNSRIQFAVGVQDYGTHNATYHNNYYVTSQYFGDNFDITVGHGKGDSKNQMSPRYLDGLFAGARWRFNEHIDLITDYDGTGVNGGLRLTAPNNWLPDGWELNTTIQGFSDSSAPNRDNAWLSLGLKIDLGGSTRRTAQTYRYKTYGLDTEAGRDQYLSSLSTNLANDTVNAKNDTPIPNPQTVLAKLNELGLQNLRAGEIDGTPVISYENNRYLHNELDALGAALGITSQHYKSWHYVVMLNKQIPVAAIKVHGAYLQEAKAKKARPYIRHLKYIQSGLTNLIDQINWQTDTIANSNYLPRINFSVAQRSSLGSEWGVLDYSTALASNAVFDLWAGASLDVRHLYPIVESDDAGFPGHPIVPFENTVDRILLHQALSLNGNLFTQLSIGKVYDDYFAVINESRWQSDTGQHQLKLTGGIYEPLEDSSNKNNLQSALGYYRYYFPDARHGIELSGGRYLNGDTGIGLRTIHWFDDTQVNLEIKSNDDQVYAGLYFAFPLSKPQSMRPSSFQLTGVDEWRWGYRTQLNSNANTINDAILVEPKLQHNVERVYFNRDRLSMQYFYANLPTIMHAMQSVTEN